VNVRTSAWRRLAYGGARHGPKFWLRYSPAFFGAAIACILPEERTRIRQSLRLVSARRGALREHLDVIRTFVAYAHCLAESLAIERPEAIASVPVVLGLEHLQAALDLGRGVVLVTAHTGAWDVAARSLARDHALDVLLVMAAEQDAEARGIQDDLRHRLGVRVLHVGRHPLDALPVLRHLKKGGLVAVQLDRVTRSESAVEVELRGRPFSVPSGPFRLASLAGAPVVPVFSRRTGYFQYEITVCPALRVQPNATPAELAEAAGRAAGDMGRFLGENPTQWFHFSH
jgi:KDO2-lipid IV(A) lauroyltransferase